jgi:O-antigen/teichoic acid export membrane protein
VSSELTARLANISLRGLSMGSRFILIFALAKLLEPAELGLFGLILATVSFSVLVIGADFYTYSQRELLARESTEWAFVIQHQITAQLVLYALILPLQIMVFWFELLPWEYLYWFFALLITEHISQEINRLLIAMQKQLLASWVLFIRMGAWVFIVIPFMYLYPEWNNLNTILLAWLLGSAAAMMLGGFVIKNSVLDWNKFSLDKKWILNGFKVGGLFLLATICFKGLLTYDRYAVEALSSLDVLGVYVFYMGIIMGAISVLDPAVFSFLYPRMLHSYSRKDFVAFKKTFKELIVSTLLISLLLSGIAWFAMPYFIDWLDKPIYKEHIDAFMVLIFMGIAYGIGMIPHYALYAMRKDKWIVIAHISSMGVFVIALKLLQLNTGIMTVSVALLTAFIWMGLVKAVGYLSTKRQIEYIAI